MKELEFKQDKFIVKWMAHSIPMLVFYHADGTDTRIAMNKRDLQKVGKELYEFIKFYEEDFSPKNIDKSLTQQDFEDDM